MESKIYSYSDKSWYLASLFWLMGGIVLILILVSKFFIIGVFILIVLYFSVRKKFFRFTIYKDYIELKNMVSTKRRKKEDFCKASIISGSMYSRKSVVLLTKDNLVVSFIPRNKSEALEVIDKLEAFGILFVKNKLYKNLSEWSRQRDEGEGAW